MKKLFILSFLSGVLMSLPLFAQQAQTERWYDLLCKKVQALKAAEKVTYNHTTQHFRRGTMDEQLSPRYHEIDHLLSQHATLNVFVPNRSSGDPSDVLPSFSTREYTLLKTIFSTKPHESSLRPKAKKAWLLTNPGIEGMRAQEQYVYLYFQQDKAHFGIVFNLQEYTVSFYKGNDYPLYLPLQPRPQDSLL